MDKRLISWVKSRLPFLFELVTQSPFISKCIIELDRGRFICCMLKQEPYFGTVMLAGQTWEERKYFMRCLVEDQIRKQKAGHLI